MRKLIKSIKSVSNTKKTLLEKIYLSGYLDWFFNIIYWIRDKYEMIKRMLFWGWKLRNNADFDSHFLYEIIHLKLRKIYECHRDHGHCVWNSSKNNKQMRKLRECYELAKRLYDDEYRLNKVSKIMDKYKSNQSKNNFVESYYPEAKAINHKLYTFIIKRSMDKDNAILKERKDRLFTLLYKYIDEWWD